jgi:hypothetical protein
MKRQMDAARSGDVPADAAESVRTLMETVRRFVELVDRKSGSTVGIVFCETEEDMRRADAALNSMSPPQEVGKRTSVDIYEVALDERFD